MCNRILPEHRNRLHSRKELFSHPNHNNPSNRSSRNSRPSANECNSPRNRNSPRNQSSNNRSNSVSNVRSHLVRCRRSSLQCLNVPRLLHHGLLRPLQNHLRLFTRCNLGNP